ncbi:MAG: hypothetical protein QMD71_07995 [bacterium]|nr:hypothetical protein [bacterium]
MNHYFIYIMVGLLIGCSKESPKKAAKEFKPPADGKITQEMASSYINASKYLMDAIARHEKEVQEFTKRYNISSGLDELSDSIYCSEHPEVMRSWNRLQERWKDSELKAYEKAGISEDEFNWIGGALTDTVNKDMQAYIAKQLELIIKK